VKTSGHISLSFFELVDAVTMGKDLMIHVYLCCMFAVLAEQICQCTDKYRADHTTNKMYVTDPH
jgi:hypothetical protein